MKKHIVAFCISMLLASLAIAKNELPIITDINKASTELQSWMKNNPPKVKPEHLELIATTDKRQYLLGEPITLTIAVKNNTENDLELDYPLGFFTATAITVFKPSDSKQMAAPDERKPETTMKKARYRGIIPGNIGFVGGPDDPYKIPAKGVLSRSCILSNWYDLTYPDGKYTVTINHKIKQNLQFVFALDAKLSFEILPLIATTDAITAEDMINVFGKKKTIDILGKEAEFILAEIEAEKVADIEMSSKYDRLMLILRTLDECSTHLRLDRRLKFLEENNSLGIKELREFINTCQSNSNNHP